ncbi:MAG TPA: hypothetical protein VFJ07_10020 [Streptosporangiaceae bacterium]|nr:hypothetical protein [Streptosporangiaceae bacterium]
MRCAAEPRPRPPGTRARNTATGRAARWVAVLAAACLLAACTGAPGAAKHHARSSLNPFGGRRPLRIAPRVVILGGGGAAGGGPPVIFIGAGPAHGSRPKITVPPIPPADSSLTIAMPLEAYQAISTQQQEALADASNLLVQRCMAARGFDDTSSGSPPLSSVATLEQVETGGAGLTSLTQARTFGFGRPKGAGSAPSGPQIIGFVSAAGFGQSLKAGRAYAEALFGFGPGTGSGPGGHLGCLQQASKQVYGQLFGEPVPDPVPQIAEQAASYTQTDPRIRAVNRAWSACMARHFYHYASPAQVEGHRWKTPPDKAEIATAVADVTCKAKTNLLNTWLAVEAAYQQALIAQNLATLSQLQANFAPLLRRANAALAAAR